jgi:hypothetical protein
VALWRRKVPQAAELWDLIQMQGRLFGLMAVGKKESSQMDHKIGGAAVAGVLNQGNVLELVDLLFLARHGVTFPRFVSS